MSAEVLPCLFAGATFRSQWLHSTNLDAPLDHDVRYVRRCPTADHRGGSPESGIISHSALTHADPFQVTMETSSAMHESSQSHMADVVRRLGIADWYADADDSTPTSSPTDEMEPRRLSPIKEGTELGEDVYERMAWIATQASRIPRFVPQSRRRSHKVSRIPRPSTTGMHARWKTAESTGAPCARCKCQRSH